MKKAMILMAFLAVCNYEFGQKRFSVEPSFGLNMASLPKVELEKNYKITFHGDILARYHFSDKFSINLGVGLSDRRFQYASADTSFVLDRFNSFFSPIGIDVDSFDSTLSANGISLEEYKYTKGIAKVLQLQIPISVTYTYKALQIEAGGYLGFKIHSSRKEETSTRVPLFETVDISSYDTTGLISMFLPPANETTTSNPIEDSDLSSFIYGLRFGLGYQYDSHLKFYGNFNLDLHDYKIDAVNLLSNNKYYFRLGMAYSIHSVKVNEDENKPSFY